MACVVIRPGSRGGNISVVENYKDESGKERQKWSRADTVEEAEIRCKQIELEKAMGTYVLPNDVTVREFFCVFCETYGGSRWGASSFTNNKGLIRNYINPILGDTRVQDIDARAADQFVRRLEVTNPVEAKGRKASSQYLSVSTITKIVKLLKTAFKHAVRWKVARENPFLDVIMPKAQKTICEIWDVDTFVAALEACEDNRLALAMHLAFACSLRIGEICGLTWDCVHIADVEIANDKAYLRVDKTLARVSKDAIAVLRGADIIKEFRGKNDSVSQTKLVLKSPKTQSSIRKIWIPATLAKILRTWQAQQKEIMRVLGNMYHDNNLVLAMDDGRPCEDAVIRKAFRKLQDKADLPRVTFHSLRHLSTGYKLVCSHGDVKSVQGDTGHSRAEMVTDVYAHIVDEDRRNNARRFEVDFYGNLNLRADYRHDNSQDENPANIDLRALLVQLRNEPQLAKEFYTLLMDSING